MYIYLTIDLLCEVIYYVVALIYFRILFLLAVTSASFFFPFFSFRNYLCTDFGRLILIATYYVYVISV